MKKVILLVLLFLFNFSFAQTSKSSFTLENRKITDYPFNPVISEKINEKIVLKKEYQFLDSLNFRSIHYKSFDNLKLRGFLIEPKKKGNYPVLIYNRGGNGNFGAVNSVFLTEFLSKIANEGYIVIGSQLRGTSVSEGVDEFGGKDVNDVLSLFDIIDQLPNADKNRIGVFGWSRGVMTNFLMLKKTNRIKTNIAIAGQADLIETKRPEMFGVYRERIPGYAKDSVAALKTRSSLLAIDSIQNKKVSHFIIQGNKDVKVDISNAFAFYSKLNSKEYTTRLLVYENEGHDLEIVNDNLLNQIADWLKRYL
ncbi:MULTISPECIES: alpha/beta hydrolase family protein [unclassified Flavobacterium]|uniref:alpha/beta hydrolase family protein n=1 Tax=unclassified Flavobacterium TaxID=196869 RepID=UPI002B22C820|nr:prolyl oligopeptidase family serine peptidase [Flavobacterium sp. PL02]MEA9413635.1 prolyl oligopeptidase family serine peptidase [Flavobacterium sp. PL02]